MDDSQAFLDSLPEVKPGETFRFACHPDVPCFNACCGDLTLMLTPYDALRLRRELNEGSKEFIQGRAEVSTAPDTGFPTLRLKMMDGEGKPCPFVSKEGCKVYLNRPSACRGYPVGRASKLGGEDEIIEQFFLVQEPHCRGFEQDVEWTPETWVADQGLEDYNASNDRYVKLLARQKRAGAAIDGRKATMALMALYQLDNFQRFIRDMNIFSRLDVDEERQQAILDDEEAALEFAMDWVELVLFNECENLRKIDPEETE
ncbi:YkgJ family cysteine cluster protein [Desulfohalovibrio reitneri]|uniref:YkgJ family cysteine cluster protein n=1 Tax=Desulfohalovibrio reitneri TaxID=1307759 RepID=UPI0004A774B0|nr:YkgJ family cysteine cluster protein [Desulfohalovibrio reitneri]